MSTAVMRHGAALAAAVTLILMPMAAAADEESRSLWITSGEVGVGPIDEDVFLHLTPRLTFLRPAPLMLCDDTRPQACETFFEFSLQVPLRFRIADREPVQDERLRREDWHDTSDFFRIIRRIEYGSSRDPVHLRAGEIGPVQLGNASIVNGYYNVITTDHYQLGMQGYIDKPKGGVEFFTNDLTRPNLFGLRARARPSKLYDSNSDQRRFTLGATVVTDTTAPTRLEAVGDELASVGADRRPVVDTRRSTLIYGADIQWEALRYETWSLTPFVDFNHHIRLGNGVHMGLLWDQNIGERLRLSSRLEYRLLLSQYLPDYIDPLYEITRLQHRAFDSPDLAGPKLTAAASMESRTRHGGFGQFQARFSELLTLSAALSDASGATGAALRLRASVDYGERARAGLFYYQFAPGERRFSQTPAALLTLDGALVASEARVAIWGPLYAHSQLARQWRLRDDGRFENIHLWNAGLGAGATF